MLTKRGKRLLQTDDDEDERIMPKKFRRQDENEEDVNIFSNQELGERWGENMNTYNFPKYEKDDVDMDYSSDSTEENTDDRTSENVGGFYRPSQNSLSSRNSAKYVNSGMNTMETGSIRLGQSCPMDCHSRGSSNIPKATRHLHNCQYCTTRKKSQKRNVNLSRQSSKRIMKSTSRKSRSRTRPSTTNQIKKMFRRISDRTQSKSKQHIRLHFCKFCAGVGKSSNRSMKLSRQASRRSLRSRTSRRSLKSKMSRKSLKSKASRRSLKSKMSRKSLKSKASRRSLKSKMSRKSLKSKMSRKIRLPTTGRNSRNITRSHSRTSMTSRCKRRMSSTGRCTCSKCKVGNKKGDYSFPREIFNRLVSYYQNNVKQMKNNKK